jgi:DNA-binding HxlR family transcriptional regulator
LIKGVERGDIARIEDKAHPGRFLYHLTAKGKKASKAGA